MANEGADSPSLDGPTQPNTPEPETTPAGTPNLIRQVSFPTAIRTRLEVAKSYPSHLRNIFQNPANLLAQRLPWMTEYHPEYAHFVEEIGGHPVGLFDWSTIETTIGKENHEACAIDLYFYERFVASGGKEDQHNSPEQHLRAWNRFVRKFNSNPTDWLTRLRLNEEAFFNTNSPTAVMIKIHCICASNGWACAVETKYKCPMCYDSAKKLNLLRPNDGIVVSDDLLSAMSLLDAVMNVDKLYLSSQISEIKNGNRKRDLRIFKLEQALTSSPPQQRQRT